MKYILLLAIVASAHSAWLTSRISHHSNDDFGFGVLLRVSWLCVVAAWAIYIGMGIRIGEWI